MLRRKIGKLLGDRLPDNLASALRVASLSMKLMKGHFDSRLSEFFEVPHEIEALQNEIVTPQKFSPVSKIVRNLQGLIMGGY
uniref:Uncharacterized protein n=1 Tax=Nymphaea colorata TaxID=210225 RepID=A0A5K1FRW9_9MAGN